MSEYYTADAPALDNSPARSCSSTVHVAAAVVNFAASVLVLPYALVFAALAASSDNAIARQASLIVLSQFVASVVVLLAVLYNLVRERRWIPLLVSVSVSAAAAYVTFRPREAGAVDPAGGETGETGETGDGAVDEAGDARALVRRVVRRAGLRPLAGTQLN